MSNLPEQDFVDTQLGWAEHYWKDYCGKEDLIAQRQKLVPNSNTTDETEMFNEMREFTVTQAKERWFDTEIHHSLTMETGQRI